MKQLVMDDKIVQLVSSRTVVVNGKIHAEAAKMVIIVMWIRKRQ